MHVYSVGRNVILSGTKNRSLTLRPTDTVVGIQAYVVLHLGNSSVIQVVSQGNRIGTNIDFVIQVFTHLTIIRSLGILVQQIDSEIVQNCC